MPPPYPPKKSNTGLIIGLIIAGVVVCCLGPALLLGGGIFWGMKTVGPMAQCAMGIEDAQKALRDYANDHDGRLPKAATWQDDIRTYYEKESKKKGKDGNPFGVMPANGDWGCDAGETKTGFAFNSDLSGKKLTEIKDGSTPMLFEVPKRGRNLSMKYVKQDPNQSPKLFNERRGWFIAPVVGDPDMVGGKGKKVNFNTGD